MEKGSYSSRSLTTSTAAAEGAALQRKWRSNATAAVAAEESQIAASTERWLSGELVFAPEGIEFVTISNPLDKESYGMLT